MASCCCVKLSCNSRRTLSLSVFCSQVLKINHPAIWLGGRSVLSVLINVIVLTPFVIVIHGGACPFKRLSAAQYCHRFSYETVFCVPKHSQQLHPHAPFV